MAALLCKDVVFSEKMADNSGYGAKTNLASWRPILPVGWFYLGQSATRDWSSAPSGLIFRPLAPDALRDIVAWERVWDSAGSDNQKDLALWRGVPPDPGYVVVGGILSTNPGFAPPTAEQTRGIRAIRRDLVVIDTTTKVWDNEGSGAKQDGSIWQTSGARGVEVNALIPVGSHDAPVEAQALSLNQYKLR
ncbi:FDS protein [Mycena latifolia]|nr:FDS protein [Mycena latifolia]